MYNVTIICTIHKEVGNCNSLELYKIIGKYKPNVIFEELRPTIYEECYQINAFGLTKRTTLETTAIKMHLQNHNIVHVPVVSAEENKNLQAKFDTMNGYQSWRDIVDEIEFRESCYGFSFTNSSQSEQCFDMIKLLEKRVLEIADDQNLSRIFQLADEEVNDYENGIVKNVYQFSEQNKYDKALMFIGAAHRKSIMKKVREYENVNNLKLNWSFYNNQA